MDCHRSSSYLLFALGSRDYLKKVVGENKFSGGLSGYGNWTSNFLRGIYPVRDSILGCYVFSQKGLD